MATAPWFSRCSNSRIDLFEADGAAHKLDDDVEASYYGRSETMIIRPHLDLQQVSNRRTIVHEATHAIQDVQLAGKWTWSLDEEATAYIAEWLFVIYCSPNTHHLRNKPDPNDPIEVIACEIARALAGNRRRVARRGCKCGAWGMRSSTTRPIRSTCCCTPGPAKTASLRRISPRGCARTPLGAALALHARRTSRKFRLRTLPLALRGSAPSRRRNVSGTL